MTADAHDLALLFDGLLDAQAKPDRVGPFGLWTSPAPWPHPVRPTAGTRITESDVEALVGRMRELGINPAIEWVIEEHPELEALLLAHGAKTDRTPALALDESALSDAPSLPFGYVVLQQRPTDSDADLLAARVVADLGFSNPCVAVGDVGTAQRDDMLAQGLAAGSGRAYIDFARARLLSGDLALFVANNGGGIVAGAAVLSGAGGTEIAGVATLPAYRRRGLAAAITHAAVQYARTSHKLPLALSAADAEVARIYERHGFVRVATTAEARLPAPVPSI
jgi:GNAT superfamily N-acetyltransferase